MEFQTKLRASRSRKRTARGLPGFSAGLVSGAAGDFAAAEKALGRARAAAPPAAGFYCHSGEILLEAGRSLDAQGSLQAALRIEPQNEKARRLLEVTRSLYSPSRAVSMLWTILILLTLFTLHEYAHAFAAHRFGDDTAKRAGRLTLNPIVHLDLVGSLVLPAILLWRQSEIVFGWARPVPVNPDNYTDRKRGTVFVSFAGSGMNLAAALASFLLILLILLVVRLVSPRAVFYAVAQFSPPLAVADSPLGPYVSPLLAFLKQFFQTSLVLGFLNLLPIPPRDVFSKKEIRKPEDFKGMKFRVPGLEMYLKTFEAMGTEPVRIAYGEAYMALSQGLVEGIENPPDSGSGMKFHQVAKYIVPTGHIRSSIVFAMNNAKWQQLTPKNQELLMKAIQAGKDFYTNQMESELAAIRKKMTEEGAAFLPPIDIKGFQAKLAETAKQQEAAGAWTAGMWERIQAIK